MIQIKAENARQVYILGMAIAKFSNAEMDHFGLQLIVHVLIRGSQEYGKQLTWGIRRVPG